jgi:hypothetical protein
MPRSPVISLGLLTFALASAAQARPTSALSPTRTSSAGEAQGSPGTKRDKLTHRRSAESKGHSDGWMLILQGVANVPLDVGAELGFETPFGLRLFGGYGWIVAPYADWLRGSSITEGSASAVIDDAQASGRLLRAKLGLRPFRKLGLYFDAGYARADFDGTVNIVGSITNLGSLSGGYNVHSTLDLWLLELGYQATIANRLVLALGLGFTGTMDSRTTITPLGLATYAGSTSQAEASVDRAIEKYGFVPTLNLRLGFNLL